VDYRKLKEITIKNRHALQLITALQGQLRKAKIFSKIDLYSAFDLFRMNPKSQLLTAVRCRYGHFKYRMIPFGLTNAPAVFQGFISRIFKDLLDIQLVLYIDNIMVFSETAAQHSKLLEEGFKRIK
jgi:Reverse transcriptase (RNA-dependent DNA polymerase)